MISGSDTLNDVGTAPLNSGAKWQVAQRALPMYTLNPCRSAGVSAELSPRAARSNRESRAMSVRTYAAMAIRSLTPVTALSAPTPNVRANATRYELSPARRWAASSGELAISVGDRSTRATCSSSVAARSSSNSAGCNALLSNVGVRRTGALVVPTSSEGRARPSLNARCG